MSSPLISIIIPSFNSAGKIEATVRSALEQTGASLEVLVMDGQSEDGTLTILERLSKDTPLLHTVSSRDTGIYDAMNKGIALSRGEYLYFLGAGDHLRPGVLQTVCGKLETRMRSDPNSSLPLLLYGDVYWTENNRIYGGSFNRYKIAIANICHQAIFYQRAIFERLGEYESRYRNCADHVLNIRCFGEPLIGKIHLDLVVANFEGAGASSNRSDEAFIQDRSELVWKYLGKDAWMFAKATLLLRRLHPRRAVPALCRRLGTIITKTAS